MIDDYNKGQGIEDGVYVPIWPYDIAQADVVYPATYE